jgi:DNA (cytosine-5)-methyltransferase 1
MPRGRRKPSAIDLFSGCGGLSVGLSRAGFSVLAAVESEPLACDTYALNHPRTRLYRSDIRDIEPRTVLDELGMAEGDLDLLAGCPPCQGFSTIRTRNGPADANEPMNDLVFEFLRFALAMKPKLLMMENVPGLARDERLELMIAQLKAVGYHCRFEVFNAADFGAPQRRRRMILVGALGAKPEFAKPSGRLRTVKGVIGRLPDPADSNDPLHNYQVRRSPHVERIMKSIPLDGGSRGSLPPGLRLVCHEHSDGFKDVYGRMAWSRPAPTITGGCINPSKGRFLHPTADRAITLREAALLQGFPQDYQFSLRRGRYPAAQMIGNAFPPIFAQKHAIELKKLIRGQEN